MRWPESLPPAPEETPQRSRPAAEGELRAQRLWKGSRCQPWREFRRADRLALYEAVRRHGGSRAWAERLGWRSRRSP